MPFEQFPYTNFHELNEDWLIKTVKEVKNKAENIDTSVEEANAAADNAKDSELNAKTSEDNAALALQNINSYTAALSAQVQNNSNDINVNSSRIDAFTQLAEGSTTGDAELQDIRVWYDGQTSNTAGDAVRGQASALNSAIQKINNMFGTYDAGTKVSEIQGSTKVVNTSANAATSGSYIGVKLTQTAGYETYYFIATKSMSLYFGNIQSNYLALCLGHNFTSTAVDGSGTTYLLSSNPVRYRKSQGDLPTQASPLSIVSGDVIAISVTAGGEDLIYGLDESLQPIAPQLHFEKTATSMNIYIDNSCFKLSKVTNVQSNVDIWRITEYDLKDYTVWINQDSESVVKLHNEDDFIGGYHGNELQTGFAMYADGVNITENSIVGDTKFNELNIFIDSDIYSRLDATKVFERKTYLNFTSSGLKQITKWTAVRNVLVDVWYNAMLSCEITDIVGNSNGNQMLNTFFTDFEPYPHAIGSNINPSEYNEEVAFITSNGTIKMNAFTKIRNMAGRVRYYNTQSREKAYFYGINSNDGENISTGEVLIGGSHLYTILPKQL